ncbi:MAG TPA: lamin tail domain-containing protein [Vulgatibacter sp.]|nr:lamin tail domain-containing protein [Vulgatibacter sp.]
MSILAALSTVLSACGSSEKEPEPVLPDAAAIVSFEVAPEAVKAGETVTASWETRNAAAIRLTANGEPIELGDAVPSQGSVTVEVSEETLFVLVATGAGGDEATSEKTVRIIGDAPAVISFFADPEELDDPGEVTLSWKTRNADAVRITRGGGVEVELGTAAAEEGSVTVMVEGTETFTLVAERGAESDGRSLTVKLKGAPEASLSIAPDLIAFGDEATLTWETTDAASVTLADAAGNELEGGPFEVQGSLTVQPAASTTYWLTAVGAGGKETKVSASVQVTPAILAFEATDPSPAAVGDSKELTWRTGGALEVEISNLDGEAVTFTGDEALEGMATLPMGAEGTFRILARSGNLTAQSEIQIEVVVDPVIGSFTADRDVVSLVDGSATVTLSWSGVARADELELVGDTTGPIELDEVAPEGTIDVAIDADTTFTLTARNTAGTASRTVDVRAVPLPVVEDFQALPGYVGPGEEVLLSWTTSDATHVEIFHDGVEIEGPHDPSGSVTVTLQVSANFEIVAYNDALDTDTGATSVTVGQPQILDFDASDLHVWVGESVILSWETLGASTLAISTADGEVHTTSIRSEVDGGQTAPIVLSEEGLVTFTLEVENLSGQTATQTVTVKASTGPGIAMFSIAPTALLQGTPIVVSWSATPDPDGNEPTLSLTADRGGPYDLPAGSAGTTQFTLNETGEYAFTFTASTSAASSTPATRSETVRVHGVPGVSIDADPLVYDDDVHSGVTLSWVSTNADQSLEIFEVVPDATDVLLHSVPEDERAAGSFVANGPTAETTYRIVATNGLAMTAEAEVTVTLQPAEILTFDATPPAYPEPPAPPTIGVVAGDEVLLEWTTRKADNVSLDILAGYVFSETSEPFFDVSANGGTKAVMTHNWCSSCPTGDEGQGVITFPAGFTFPFGGEDREELMVWSNGLLGFDMHWDASSQTSFSNDNLATTSKSWVHMAVFWDDLQAQDTAASDIWYGTGSDTRGDFFAIQWKSIEFPTSTANMNFEILLRPDGTFEYRYGTMQAISAAQERVDGNGATIGYMLPGRTSYHVFSHNTAVSGGLQNRSFRYEVPPSLAPNGSYAWSPLGGAGPTNRSVTLTARNAQGSDSETITVEVHPRAAATATAPESAVRNQDFTLSWTTQNATAVVVEDQTGTTRCTAAAGQIASGSCVLSESTGGPKTYTVIATGALGHTVSADAEVTIVSADFGIMSFTASADEIDLNDPVTLSWVTGDADALRIFANGVEVALPPTIDLDEDSVTLTPQETTTYELEIENTLFGTRTETLTVVVRTATVTLTPSATVVHPGTPVTIAWAATSLNGGPVTVEVPFLEMVEDVSGTAPFEDISQLPDVVTLRGSGTDTTVTSHVFADGFTFPFDGAERTSVRVSPDGYLSFDTSTTTVANNVPFPADGSSERRVHLAPFWDDLHTRSNGRIYAAKVGADYMIQWSTMSPTTGSSNSDEWNLNFQVVLHADGSFEYRYGTMAPRTTPSTSCYPDDCTNEANGSSATIGYQNTTGTAGYTHHFGGTSNADGNPAFPGGLSNRTFRYDLPGANGVATFTPRASGDYTVCVNQGGYRTCETVRVEAEFKIDSFEVDDDSIDWNEAVEFSWTTTGADALVLKKGSDMLVDDSTVGIAAGTFPYSPEETATYTLEIWNDFLRQTVTATRTVDVRQFDLTLTPSTAVANPGDPVTLTWTASMLSGGDFVLTTPMTEVSGTVGYTDISGLPDAVELIGASEDTKVVDHVFADGFTFDYFGTEQTQVRVSTDGFLSFQSGASTTSGNVALPSTTEKKVHLAAFWDDLGTRTNGRVHAAPVGTDYVFQWSNMSMWSGSSTSMFHNLNFQIVLHADGSFTYAYGTMEGLSGTDTSSSCHPNTCVNEANGASATIGYQEPTGVAGHLVHFGGTSNGASNFPVAGGLSNRAFRFSPQSAGGSVVVNPTDRTSYRICAISGTLFECTEPVVVDAGWTIKSFNADASSVVPNQPVTLSWDTAGGDAISLVATVDGTDTVIPITDFTGSHVDVLQDKTTYTLSLSSFGRVKTRTVEVEARNVEVSLAASQEALLPGESSTLTWTVATHTAGDLMTEGPLVEVSGAGTSFADLDISQDPNVEVLHLGGLDDDRATVTFQPGFEFPYMGTPRTTMVVSVNGWISFDTASTATRASNAVIPTTDSTNRTVHLAPFWDDLHTRTSGRVYGLQVDPDTYVVQWSKISSLTASSNTAEYDLNFMVVLHSDGRFEYRYGTMAPPATPSSTSCEPDDCVNEAMGSSATIGYQDPTGTIGRTLHFGGSSSAAANVVFPGGGLANRTFVYPWSAAGSATITPRTSATYLLCATLDGYKECSVVPIEVLEPGSVTITELVVDPAGGPGGEWFEVKNATGASVDLDGWTITTDGGSHTIAGPLVVPPGGFATLAASATVGFPPDYVFGAGLPFDPTGDTLSLAASPTAPIASVTWDASWNHPVDGSSLSLDGSFVQVGVGSHDDADSWCTGAPSPGEMGDGCVNAFYSLDKYSSVPFIDLTSSGIVLSSLHGDGSTAEIPVPFSMPFYGETVTKLWANSNGYVSFSATSPGNGHFAPSALPRTGTSSPTGPLVLALWDDLGCTNAAMRFRYDQQEIGGETVTILQWSDYRRCGRDVVTLQVQLWSGGDVVIAFSDANESGPWASATGREAWTGLESRDRSENFTAFFRQAAIRPGQSILFRMK